MRPGFPLSFFSTQISFFSRPVCLDYYEKSRDICAFWSDKLINNFNVSSNIKITLHYSGGSQSGRNSSPGRNYMSSGEEFPLTVLLPIHCKCCTSLLNISLYICKLFSWLSHVFADKLQCHYLTTNSFGPTFINQVIVVNKDHCSNCGKY